MENKKTYRVGCSHNLQREFIYPTTLEHMDRAGKKRKSKPVAKFDSSMSIILRCSQGCDDVVIYLDKCKR